MNDAAINANKRALAKQMELEAQLNAFDPHQPTREYVNTLKAEIDTLRRLATDRRYMMEAYRNMLGEKGLEVARMWEKNRVLRVHHDWTEEAAELTGEQRADHILAWERAPRRLVENID